MPVIQLTGVLFNNAFYYLTDNNTLSNCIDYTLGNSLIVICLLYFCSYVFYFCKWHRIIITANLVNITIANIDILIGIPINDLQLLLTYYLFSAIFIITATISHIKENNHGHKT